MTPPERIGPYRLLAPLGQGGMGIVYRAEHSETGQAVALKTIHSPEGGSLNGIRREIRALARLRHPGVVRILDEGVTPKEGLPWYAMELLPGVHLGQWRAGLNHSGPAFGPQEKTAPASLWWTKTLPLPEPRGDLCIPAASPAHPDATRSLSPEKLLSILTMARRLCAPLAFLHGEGLLHRDLKPENILVVREGEREEGRGGRGPSGQGRGKRGEGRGGRQEAGLEEKGSQKDFPEHSLKNPPLAPALFPLPSPLSPALPPLAPALFPLPSSLSPVLVDFGLSSEYGGKVSREKLAIEAGLAGTVHYMSPEQILEEPLDARADLYALGVILFELLTGRRPFEGARPAKVLRAHLHTAPPAPSTLCPGIPPALDDLVLRLLAKERARRPGYADDVAASLFALGASGEREEALPCPRTYFYRPSLSGRGPQLARLGGLLSRMDNEQGGLVLLGGESGVGKTRLASELGREALRGGKTVLVGECQDTRAPLSAFQRPLRCIADHCRERGVEETERIFGRRGLVLASYEPSLEGLPGQDAYPAPAELPAQAAMQRLFSFLGETLLAFAEEDPLCLVLDDLQWADDLSLGFLRHFLKGGPLRRWLFVIGTYRSEETNEALKTLLEHPEAEGMLLGRLDEEAVSRMIGDMLALPLVPGHLGRYLAKNSEGNPFFVAEYLRAAAEEKLLWRDEGGLWRSTEDGSLGGYERLPLPGSLKELIGRRLSGLPGGARAVLNAATILGRELPIPLLEGTAGLPEESFGEALGELFRRQVLEERGSERLSFVHDKLREVSYEQLGEEERPGLHRAAALALSGMSETKEARGEDLAKLGHHWEGAGEEGRARGYYLRAARRATEVYSLAEAERLYRSYLRLVKEPSLESINARHELGEKVLEVSGQREGAFAIYEGALGEARSIGSLDAEAESLFPMGRISWRRSQAEEARGFYEQAHALFRATGNKKGEARCLINLALMRYEQGGYGEAEALYGQALSLTREAGDRQREGQTLCNLALLYTSLGRMKEARRSYQQAILHAREVGDRRSEGIALGNLAILCQKEDLLEEARDLFQKALVIHHEMGNRPWEGYTLGLLADVCVDLGLWEEAWDLSDRALAIAVEVDDRHDRGSHLIIRARLARLTGDLAGASSFVRESRRVVEGLKNLLVYAWIEEGHLSLAEGSSAGEILLEAEALAREMGAGPESSLGRKIARLAQAEAAFARGERGLLFAGELIEGLSLPIRRALVRAGRIEEGYEREAPR